MYSRKVLVLLKAGYHSPRGFYFICKLAVAGWNKQVFNYLTERRDVERSLCPWPRRTSQPSQPGGNNPNFIPCPRAAVHLHSCSGPQDPHKETLQLWNNFAPGSSWKSGNLNHFLIFKVVCISLWKASLEPLGFALL